MDLPPIKTTAEQANRPATTLEQQAERHRRETDDLEKAASEARGLREHQVRSRSALDLAMDLPCEEHSAARGEPCWTTPRAVCGPRQRAAQSAVVAGFEAERERQAAQQRAIERAAQKAAKNARYVAMSRGQRAAQERRAAS